MRNRNLLYFDHCIPKGPARTVIGNPFSTKSAEISLGKDFDYRDIIEAVKKHTGLIISNPASDVKIVSSTMGIGRHVDSPDRPFTIVFPMNEIALESTTRFYVDVDGPAISNEFQFKDFTPKLIDTCSSHEVIPASEKRRDTVMILIRDTSTMLPHLKKYFNLKEKMHNDWMNVPKIEVNMTSIYDHLNTPGKTFDWIDYTVPRDANRVRHGPWEEVESGEVSLGVDFDYQEIINHVAKSTGAIVVNPLTDIKVLTTKTGLKKHVDRNDRPFTVITPMNEIANMTQTIFYKDETCTDISSVLKYNNDSKILKTSKWHEVIQEQQGKRRDTLMVLIRDTSKLYPNIKNFFGIL